MTEHLKKQMEAAAGDCSDAKRKFRSANETIVSQNSLISSHKISIQSSEEAIARATQAIDAAVEARSSANDEFEQASARLSFFNRELIDHPHVGL